MGCDIHWVIESVDGEGEFQEVSFIAAQMYFHRNYALFAQMADVRNALPEDDGYLVPISKPRGLPDNLHPATQILFDEWRDDAHSMSWLTTAEMKAHDFGPMAQMTADKIIGDHNWGSHRVVFWFDN